MEDENGLELSLALSCGGSSARSKGKIGGSSDSRIDEADKGNNVVDDFISFFHGGTQKQDSSTGSQKIESVNHQENFYNDLSKAAVDTDAFMNLNGRGLWVANNNKSVEVEEGKRSEAKRKMLFDEMNHQKKREKEAHHAESYEKAKTSHISITTEDGSTAENEDVADSEVEGSTSRLVSLHEDGSKRSTGGGQPYEFPKETNRHTDLSVVDSGHKRFNIPSENEFKLGNVSYGVHYAVQHLNVMNAPYQLAVKESASGGAPGTSGYPLAGIIHMAAPANGERAVNSSDLPPAFGYSPLQLPVLGKDQSWGSASHPHQLHPSFGGRNVEGGASNSERPNDGLKISHVDMQVPRPNSSEALLYAERGPEQPNADSKQHATEEGSSSQTEDTCKKRNINFRAKDASEGPRTEVFPYEGSAIRPGIAGELKFGGCGSYPNLPWVSTTGPGPNGKTISGVTFRFSGNQIRIVCACHGSHMSQEEFIRHASEEHPIPESGNGLVSYPCGNPAASAQS